MHTALSTRFEKSFSSDGRRISALRCLIHPASWKATRVLPSLIDLAASDGMLSGERPRTRGQTAETAAACTNSIRGCGAMDGGMSARSRS